MFALFKGEAIKEKAVSLHPKHESMLSFVFFTFLFFDSLWVYSLVK